MLLAVENVFLTLMVIGLAGLLVMAIPAFARHGHGHGHPAHAHGGAVARGAAHGRALGAGRAGAPVAGGGGTPGRNEVFAADPSAKSLLRLLPSPRAICSVLALYGAFANALVRAGHMKFAVAAVAALAPALLVEWFVVRPVWNLVFRFQAQPSLPLEAVVLSDATAVVPFRNGRGMVSLVRDGRLVQLAARLRDDQARVPVKVGDRLRIEDVDAERERVTVTVLSGKDLSS
jgi:hypothetical protein